MPDFAYIPLVLLIYGGGAWVAFLVLRAAWRAFSAPAVARKAGEVVGSISDAYKEGRGQ